MLLTSLVDQRIKSWARLSVMEQNCDGTEDALSFEKFLYKISKEKFTEVFSRSTNFPERGSAFLNPPSNRWTEKIPKPVWQGDIKSLHTELLNKCMNQPVLTSISCQTNACC